MKEKTFTIIIEQQSYQVAIQRLLEILLPQYKFNYDFKKDNDGVNLYARMLPASFEKGDPLVFELILVDEKKRHYEKSYHYEILDRRYKKVDYERRGKDLLKNHIYSFLVEYLKERKSPWGILTGIRPTKLIHYLRDDGFSFDEIKNILKDVYGISKEKIQLLLTIADIEEKYLPDKKEAYKRVSLYLGIPFCPSRCSYCSFPSFSLTKHGSFIQPFLETLLYEIKKIGEFIQHQGYRVDSIYIGGGTPTCLTSQQLDLLLTTIGEYIPFDGSGEFNVEAGRPDTINLEKLKILHGHGVNRISINTQTMHQKTLDLIGRQHSVDSFKEIFSLARDAGFNNINTDLIIGLPGESFSDVQVTIDQVLNLKPDSITVHTLSLKKASSWWEFAKKIPFPEDEEVTRMLDYVSYVLQNNQFIPYYMYRQKYILGNQENVGYSLPGKESVYNIIMIEERETVIGLGGGAVTKVVNPLDWSLVRHSNPKYPGDYIKNINSIINDKLSLLTSFQS